MERFDFEKVHKVMKFLNWKWAMSSNGYDVPSIEDLRAWALHQLNECVRLYESRGFPQSGMNVSSGGLQALVMTFERGDPQLQLVFYVDEQSATADL